MNEQEFDKMLAKNHAIVCPFYQELVKAREQIKQQGLHIKGLQREVFHLMFPEKGIFDENNRIEKDTSQGMADDSA